MKNRSGMILIALAFVLMAAEAAFAQVPIIEAAQRGDLETVTLFLKADSKLVEVKNAEGDTALHAAAGCRRGEEAGLPIVRLLLEKGAVLDARNASNQTPLLYAAYAGFKRIVELLVSKGAAVQYQDANGRSPIHYAAREGHPEVVEFLFKNGANLSLRDGQNRTPLEYAVLRNRTAVVDTLMRLAQVDPKSPEGSMILHMAASQGNEALVKTLLEQGADPGRPNPNGETILISYLRGGLAGRAAESIAKGADINAKDASGQTALQLAIKKGLEDVVPKLLDKGADPNIADKGGANALDIARDWGYKSTAALLTAKGARPTPSKIHLLKDGSFEIIDKPAGAQDPTAVIRYIGNEGFLIEAGSKAVLIDGLVRNPWGYTDTPQQALALMKAAQDPFGRIDLLLFSHAHRDHFEPNMALEVLSAQPQAVLAGDSLVSGELKTAAGPEAFQALGARVQTVDTKMGERTSLTAAAIPLTAIGVNHGTAERSYLTLGYIWEMGGFKFYHQGDINPEVNMPVLASIPWEEMKIDIAFFDRYFFQYEPARRIVLERIKPSAVILMHMRDEDIDGALAEMRPIIPKVLAFRTVLESKVFAKAAR